jgi:uncharacterized protein (TIGR02246 family)
MPTSATADSIIALVRSINQAWLEDRPETLAKFLHPDMTMVFPGFGGKAEGRAAVVAGFVDFCAQARVQAFDESDWRVDRTETTAVVSFRFAMVYERSGESYRATGRDLWVLAQQADGTWLAVWRTMLELEEQPA